MSAPAVAGPVVRRLRAGPERPGLPEFPGLSVVIPAWREAAGIEGAVKAAMEALPGAEVTVVDGGSDDGTAERAAAAGARVVVSARGRGVQCAAGARSSVRPDLLFLHADARLEVPAAPVVLEEALADPGFRVGTFRLRFDLDHPVLRWSAATTRFDTVFTRFGDQGIVVRRWWYESLGGFPEWPLLEDVEFLRRARRRGGVTSLPAPVVTSARRYVRDGVVRRQLANALLLMLFLAGVPPERLAGRYRAKGGGS